ncbi:DUF2147 domain-containing protein [Aureimonas altamirensis]|uniref:DUF2147 domain-containing protein n=1 Tax=Aureimonas altamirensis TaxID=370622 RepID=UPI003B978CA9
MNMVSSLAAGRNLRVWAMAICLASAGGSAMAAEPIVGNWKTENGTTVAFQDCGGAYCARIQTGEFKGREIGRMSGSGNAYTGTVTDPRNSKTYEGSATIAGNALELKGCVAKIFCRSQHWTR